MAYSFVLRSRIVLLSIIFFSLILGTKLFLVQVVRGEAYSQSADRQYSTPGGDIYERGTIFFEGKDGQLIAAATQTTGFKVAIEPGKIKDVELAYKKINEIEPLDRADFIAKASKTNDPYEEILHYLSKEEADTLSQEKISGVKIFKEKWRFYPGGSLASHVLGLVGYKDNELGGRYGLERGYNSELQRASRDLYVNFFAEVFSDINRTLFSDKVKEGDLVTTIEPTVQNFLEKKFSSCSSRQSALEILQYQSRKANPLVRLV